MKKGVYIHDSYYRDGKLVFAGVKRKIEDQITVFRNCYEMEDIELEWKNASPLLKRLPGGSRLYHWEKIIIDTDNTAFVYIRKPTFDHGFFEFVANIKRKNSDIKILLEIPTYPYDKEQFSQSLSSTPLFIKDVVFRNASGKYLDRIITYTKDKSIFQIPTINIQNGVNVQKYPIVVHDNNRRNEINLIAVASLQYYHGYERILYGMADYYKEKRDIDVRLLLVGTGEAQEELRTITHELGLEKQVVFYGMKTGEELSEIFNLGDIGLGSFGFYKIGLSKASSLKTREYLARGIPVFSGCEQDIFETAPCSYHMEIENNNSPVDIENVVRFYKDIYSNKDKNTVAGEIREYAKKYASIEKSLEPVMEYLSNTD